MNEHLVTVVLKVQEKQAALLRDSPYDFFLSRAGGYHDEEIVDSFYPEQIIVGPLPDEV